MSTKRKMRLMDEKLDAIMEHLGMEFTEEDEEDAPVESKTPGEAMIEAADALEPVKKPRKSKDVAEA